MGRVHNRVDVGKVGGVIIPRNVYKMNLGGVIIHTNVHKKTGVLPPQTPSVRKHNVCPDNHSLIARRTRNV